MPLDDSSKPNKRAHNNPDTLPDSISVASINSVSNFTNPSGSQKVILLTYDYHNANHTTMIGKPGRAM